MAKIKWKRWVLPPLGMGLALLLTPLVLLLAIVSTGSSKNQQATSAGGTSRCTASWQGDSATLSSLTSTQAEAAKIIYTVAVETGVGAEGAVVGIATAMQESTLGDDPTSRELNSDGDVGLFQQRALVGWYADGATKEANKAILNDHATAARTFFLGHTVGIDGGGNPRGYHIPGLADIKNWQSKSVAAAAQAVQVSAFPDAYAKHEKMARTAVAELKNDPGGTIICGPAGGDLNCPATGMSGEDGLQPDALRAYRCVKKTWPQINDIGGKRKEAGSDHNDGKAIDVMIPDYKTETGKALGDEIAQWAIDNTQGLGVTYVIWQERIWNKSRASEGWRECSGPHATCYSGSDDSAAHRNHVHISVEGNSGTGIGGTGNPPGPDLSLPEYPVNGLSSTVTPVKHGTYTLTARFGQTGPHWKAGHTGLDFSAPEGTPVVAVMDATVSGIQHVDPKNVAKTPYGNLVKLKNSAGLEFYCAHLSAIEVSEGQQVKTGQEIGRVGQTGNVTGAHLHFEVRSKSIAKDPETWFANNSVQL